MAIRFRNRASDQPTHRSTRVIMSVQLHLCGRPVWVFQWKWQNKKVLLVHFMCICLDRFEDLLNSLTVLSVVCLFSLIFKCCWPSSSFLSLHSPFCFLYNCSWQIFSSNSKRFANINCQYSTSVVFNAANSTLILLLMEKLFF